jgi:2,4-dienoyl-CoA reductase-like NADH-dependent reductase (Old Yellow Enzyme family)
MTQNRTADDLALLWEPVSIGPARVPNRIGLAPVTTMWVRDGVFTDQHLDYLEERARGEVGLLISEELTADRERRGFSRHVASALNPAGVPVLRELADRVHRHGSVQFVQLYGPGILDQIGIDEWGWDPPLSPSGTPSAGFSEMPEVMTRAQIREVVDNFARAASHVAAAGLDGVELHGARSELIGQFFTPLYNRRNDEYGGSPENRCRFALEIAQAVRAAAPGLAVGIQLSVDEYMGPAGLTEDLVAEQLSILAEAGVFDFYDLSTGNEFTDDVTIPPMEASHIPTERFGKRAKEIVGDSGVIMINGGVAELATAERLVRERAADIVLMSRATIADPHLVAKARRGELEQITPCLGHNDCLRSVMAQRPMTCLMNPVVGREGRWARPTTASAPRSVAVIGAGPAGMRAALTAALRGHTVSLFEASDRVGGQFDLLAQLPHRARWGTATTWFEHELARAGVTLHLGTDVTAEAPELRDADEIIVATGARWDTAGRSVFRPDREAAPGTDLPRVTDLDSAVRRALADPRSLGDRVILIDDSGDDLAAGLADLLTSRGVTVELVSKHVWPFARLFGALDHAETYQRLSAQGLRFHPQQFLDEITPDRVSLLEMWSRRPLTLEGDDTVVLAMMRTSRTDLAEALLADPTLAPRTTVIGDARAPREIRAVIAEAHAHAHAL